MEITSLDQLDLDKVYTYADYYSWKFKERVELIKGKIMAMSPAPSGFHQRIAQKINLQLSGFLNKSFCEVYFAPFVVRLERVKDDKKVINVVQPDLCVICDLSKLDDRGCNGAPELIVEILSPGNSKKEMRDKFELYEAAGVEEHWMVDPAEKVIWQYFLINGNFENYGPIIEDDSLMSRVLEGFSMDLNDVFKEQRVCWQPFVPGRHTS